MRIVVFGATGNLGLALLRELAAQPEVSSIVGVARTRPVFDMPKVEWAVADIARDALAPLLAGADVVVHLAWLIQPARDRVLLDAVNVHGTDRILRAVLATNVGVVVYASSVGAYAPGPRGGGRVDEAWATTGIPGNLYSAQKAQTERMLDAFEAAHPDRRVVRMRPALIFNGGAGAHLARVFLGPLVPRRLAAPGALPVLPMPRGLVTQLVHVDDAADAFRRAVLDPDARGAYNVATEPELTAERIAEALETRVVTVPAPLVERAVELAWRARLQPLPGSWIRLAHRSPLLDSTRAREELGWSPRVDVVSAVRDTADGVADSSGVETGPLTPRGRAHGPMPGD